MVRADAAMDESEGCGWDAVGAALSDGGVCVGDAVAAVGVVGVSGAGCWADRS